MTDNELMQTGESLNTKSSLKCCCVLRAQTCPRQAMLVAPWRTGLLLLFCFLGVCACQEEECVLGIVGRPVSLPCFYPQFNKSTFGNLSIEWRRDDEMVLRSVWKEDGNLEERSLNRATISANAKLNGDISLELPTVDPQEHSLYYSLFIISGQNASAAQCTVCLRVAASFSFPRLQMEEPEQGDEAAFSCHSSGGFPEPAVYWLINNTQEPPSGSVSTVVTELPDSNLYNVTSHLRVNISEDSSVSCTIENLAINENLTSSSLALSKPVVRRASEAMWMFSTALCVVIGLMVLAGIAYQIHLDRVSKMKKKEFQRQTSDKGIKRGSLDKEELEAIKPDPKETDV